MPCPACRTGELVETALDGGPEARRCAQCGGVWVPAAPYWQWAPTDAGIPDLPAHDHPWRTDTDTDFPKACPDCGRLISLRRKIAPGASFLIDRCGNCGGVWLDAGEWEQLVAIGLHRALHMLTSDIWQARVRVVDIDRAREETDRSMLGDETYERLVEIKAMIDASPNRSYILAFLKGERDA